jgi:hypothetical protein
MSEVPYAIAAPPQSRVRSALFGRTAILAALALSLGGGAVLRVWRIDALGFNSDETVYAGQAASIANDPSLRDLFPIFRAHPLLFQAVLSLPFRLHVSDLYGRLLETAVALATIVVVYKIGRLLYGPAAGVAAALILAAMPYDVVVSRQVLLDGPMTLLSTVALYCLARYAVQARPAWLYAAGGALGLTLLAKETAVLLLGSVYAFLALSPGIAVRLRHVLGALAVMLLTIAPYPVSLLFSGSSATGEHYLVWQLFRRANHGLLFYPEQVSLAVGPATLVAAVVGLRVLRARNSWRESLLVSWLVVPVVFFELWPVKGFHYLLVAAPPLALLAGRTLAAWPGDLRLGRLSLPGRWTRVLAVAAVLATLVPVSIGRIEPAASATFLAGSGGVPGGREVGRWVDAHVPQGATLLALGPSMANIVEFYGHRKVYGLSVSPNPLHRNPAYEPVGNPDLRIRHNDIQYLVWDAYSANRSPFFSRTLLRYADRYHGRIVHTAFVGSGGSRTPVIVVYAVRP